MAELTNKMAIGVETPAKLLSTGTATVRGITSYSLTFEPRYESEEFFRVELTEAEAKQVLETLTALLKP
jgi:hypothetical protein